MRVYAQELFPGSQQSGTGCVADHAAAISTGTHVFLEGALIYRECRRTIETESGPVNVPWPVTEIIVESLSVLDRVQKQARKGARKRSDPQRADKRSKAYVLRWLHLRTPD